MRAPSQPALVALFTVAVLAPPRPAFAQSRDHPVPEARLVGLGGSELFVAPRLSLPLGSFLLTTEGVLGRGTSGLTEGRTVLSHALPRGLALAGSYTVTHRTLGTEEAWDRGGRIGLRSDRLGGWVGLGRKRAATPAFGRDTRTLSVRAWVDLGVGVGATLRRAAIREQGEALRDTIHVILDRYEFHTRRLSRYFREGSYSELELDLSFGTGPARTTVVGGHRFGDGSAPAAHWGFVRVTLPLPRGMELLGEVGRNGGLPSLGRGPSDFLRVGLRLDLTGRGAEDGCEPSRCDAASPSGPPAAPGGRPRAEVMAEGRARTLVITAQGARRVEVRGDFTDWRPRGLEETEPGRWVHPLEVGIHRLTVRVDGGSWTVPANLPSVPDEFTGAPVAIVVIR